MSLDLSSLRQGIASLDRAVALTLAKMSSTGTPADEIELMKAGVVQNFEFTYELCWKFIQRWIRENRTPEEADHPRSRRDLFRRAASSGLIADPLPWFTYSDQRNLTSHTYNQETAQAVFETAIRFLPDAKLLYARLEASND